MVEMGENRTPRPEHSRRELPTGISGLLGFRDAGPRPAGCSARYPVAPLGSLTPLTGVGDAAPPLMTSSPSGEVGRRRCSLLFKQRGRNCRCQLQACSLIYEACEQPRPAILGPRALSKPDIPTNRLAIDSTRSTDRCEHLFDVSANVHADDLPRCVSPLYRRLLSVMGSPARGSCAVGITTAAKRHLGRDSWQETPIRPGRGYRRIRPAVFDSRSSSRRMSRSAIERRLSCVFLPRPTPSSSLARPRRM
jgi:hypothetical protein